MKKSINKLIAYLVVVFTVIFSYSACFRKPPLVLEVTETYLVIKVDNEQIPVAEDMTLLSYMEALKEEGNLTFETKDGMITAINGIENPADWSACWMLYTSDEENANTAWGEIEYEQSVYGSAMYGADQLKVKDSCLYIWVYQSM